MIDGLVPPANRTVGVRVSDGTSSATDTAQVTITNVAPTATFVAPATVNRRQPVHARADEPDPIRLRPTCRGLHVRVRLRLGLRRVRHRGKQELPDPDVGTLSVGGKIRDKDGGVTEYRATVTSIVTVESLSDLVRSFVENEGIENALLAKLRAGSIGAFINQVEAQTGKALTRAQAELLIRLARRL